MGPTLTSEASCHLLFPTAGLTVDSLELLQSHNTSCSHIFHWTLPDPSLPTWSKYPYSRLGLQAVWMFGSLRAGSLEAWKCYFLSSFSSNDHKFEKYEKWSSVVFWLAPGPWNMMLWVLPSEAMYPPWAPHWSCDLSQQMEYYRSRSLRNAYFWGVCSLDFLLRS